MPLPSPEGWRGQPDPELTMLSEAAFQEHKSYVATRLFPNVPVNTLQGRFGTIDRGSFSRDDLAPHRPGSLTKIGNLETGFGTYSTEAWKKGYTIPDESRQNAVASMPPEQVAVMSLVENALNRREARFIDAFFRRSDGTNSLWTNTRVGVATGTPTDGTEVLRWDADDSSPIDDILRLCTIIKRTGGRRPNKMVISDAVFDILTTHPDILERITGGATNADPANVMPMHLAALFRLDEVLVGDASYNDAEQGNPDDFETFLGKHVLLAYVAPSPGILVPSSGYHFTWTGMRAGGGMEMDDGNYGHVIDSWYDRDRSSEIVRVHMRDDPKIVNPDLGAFIENVIS